MSDQIKTGPLSDNPVEAAICAGKIPESRRAFYNEAFANDPEGTTRILASLEAALQPPALPRGELHRRRVGVTAVELDEESSAYPREWFAGHLHDPNDRIIKVDD